MMITPVGRTILMSLSLAVLCSAAGCAANAQQADATAALQAAINSPQRSAADVARDRYRHPLQTLEFFGVKPDMTVVEIYPGGGWYTQILAPLLKEKGTYYAAGYLPNPDSKYVTRAINNFNKQFVANPGTYGRILVTALDPTGRIKIAPDGSADRVLTFRNVHNWMAGGFADQAFRQFYAALKPGGILGVVEHRAPADTPQDPRARSGYVRQDHVIKLATDAGFVLVAESEINANPRDDKNHPKGVWTLPPVYRLGDQDRDMYTAIGESDRMTLKFRKPGG